MAEVDMPQDCLTTLGLLFFLFSLLELLHPEVLISFGCSGAKKKTVMKPDTVECTNSTWHLPPGVTVLQNLKQGCVMSNRDLQWATSSSMGSGWCLLLRMTAPEPAVMGHMVSPSFWSGLAPSCILAVLFVCSAFSRVEQKDWWRGSCFSHCPKCKVWHCQECIISVLGQPAISSLCCHEWPLWNQLRSPCKEDKTI